LEYLLQSIILGIIQGIAEWLPISSTGHLRLAEHFLGLTLPILFDVTLHIGTLVVIFVFFREDIRNVLAALARLDFKTEQGRMIPLITVGSIPTALIGLTFSTQIEATFTTVLPIAATLIISGILLYASKLAREKTEAITYTHALVFGVAQGIAIIPGISRSGTTIAVALLLGLSRTKAFRFSFLLSIPAIIGALGLTLYRQHATLTNLGFGLPEIVVGAVIAMVVGYFALSLLKRIIENRKFHMFAYYCWALGVILIVLGFSGY
jgi:undecaprenyl-diphosphatase